MSVTVQTIMMKSVADIIVKERNTSGTLGCLPFFSIPKIIDDPSAAYLILHPQPIFQVQLPADARCPIWTVQSYHDHTYVIKYSTVMLGS